MQPKGTLRGRAKHDYLLQPLQSGTKITINIRLPTGRGKDIHLFEYRQYTVASSRGCLYEPYIKGSPT